MVGFISIFEIDLLRVPISQSSLNEKKNHVIANPCSKAIAGARVGEQ